ncbi:acyl carrier protein [Oricola cellulosilytica]|uniref:Acyl carrier protein n=1 Tax=Oricola cellulosilytica TaxID=1429082 RepID=A0A4V2MPU3_9HYPH|nr:acyl carrier protein [Oricola cellulosilytica]TCD15387.1 acyl carrier protein [Oricola cellulosilytica]
MSTSTTKLADIIREALELPDTYPADKLMYSETPGWDSLAHMRIVAAVEEHFNIMMELDDITDFSDYDKGRAILIRHGV